MNGVPSWDLFIILFFVIGISYGFVLQRERIIATLLSVYVALAVVQVWSDTVHQFFLGDKTILNQIFIRYNTTPFTIQIGLFALVVILLTTRGGLITPPGSRGLMTPIELFIYSSLNTALILSSVFQFLPESSRTAFSETSKMARFIIQYHTWWVILPVIAIIVLSLRRKIVPQ